MLPGPQISSQAVSAHARPQSVDFLALHRSRASGLGGDAGQAKQWDTGCMGPMEHYSERLERRERSRARLDRLHGRIGIGRLLLAAIFVIFAWACIARHAASPAWSLLPAFLFVALVLYHQRMQMLRALTGRAVAFYRSGLER